MARKPDQNETNEIVEALQQVKTALNGAADRLEELAKSSARDGSLGAAPAVFKVNTWKDPFTEAVPTLNPPLAVPYQVSFTANTNLRLQTRIVDPEQSGGLYPVNTPGFRYWLAQEALARGINFWSAQMPAGTTWSTSNPMSVILVDATPDLNARYFRNSGLHFYKGAAGGRDFFSGDSPNIIQHELGHAVLDALRPQIFNAADAEASAFHESFGDMSAILCALQHDTIRRTVITESQGHLSVNSRLSRLAEQLGWAIRQIQLTLVDRDSLRNAANRFFYRSIDTLPPKAPSNLLSSQPHSFSRIFTGAFLDVLARMFAATGAPNEANLLAISRDLGQIIVDAVRAAPIKTGFFSQVAAEMIQADQVRFGGRNRAALTSSFVERGILSIQSAVVMANAPAPSAVPLQQGAGGGQAAAGAAMVYRYENETVDEGFRLGFGETPDLPQRPVNIAGALTIDVHAPDESQRFDVASAMTGSQAPGAHDGETAARLFVEGLIQRRELDLGSVWEVGQLGAKASGGATHTLLAKDGKQILKRNHFECGFCQRQDAILACT